MPQVNEFNFLQTLMEQIEARPLLCHAKNKRSAYCKGCEPGNTFECAKCGRLMPWCMGAGDAFEDWCDDCVATYTRTEGGFPEQTFDEILEEMK